MRLLNTSSFTLKEFTGSDIPPYAILSHRWGNHEVTFQDVTNFTNFADYFRTRKTTKTEGWSKIKGCCAQAVSDGFQWVWVDSCCIDKMSSAELSEAINSMFNWYRQAIVCYAYLSDVPILNGEQSRLNNPSMSSIDESKWFTRGWTLQELLAPKKLVFFNRHWQELGTREELWSSVSSVTGIKDEVGWEAASVAQKMSWASKRETTRIEDRAYSLMGLFGVNMPPLYGEGEKAFLRLQLEILNNSDDESIFAWKDPLNFTGGLLAHSPNAFESSGHVKRFDSIHHDKPPYSMTNKGLRMEFSLVSATWLSALDADDTFLAPLQCISEKNHSTLALLLRCIRGTQFTRIASGELISLGRWDRQTLAQIERDPNIRRIVQVKQEDDSELSFRGLYQYKFSIATHLLSVKDFEVTDRYLSDPRRLQWENNYQYKNDFGEDSILVDRVASDAGMTAALEFTRRGEDEVDKFFVIFNVYATRARLAIYVPQDDILLNGFINTKVAIRDWMTMFGHLFGSKKLKSGQIIDAQLVRNKAELGLRSYQAEIAFQEPVELPGDEVPGNLIIGLK